MLLDMTLKVKIWIGPILAIYMYRVAKQKLAPMFSLKKY